MKESESEILKIEESESELLCTDSTALVLNLPPVLQTEIRQINSEYSN
jgi:hypothetical protein